MKSGRRIGIIGGGPSGLFMFKRLLESKQDLEIEIFERSHQLGEGMPYSREGANEEHVTNVSDNEIPPLVTSVLEWLPTVPAQTLKQFNIDPERFNEYKVIPRLLFGQYLAAQFDLLLSQAKQLKIPVTVHRGSQVIDVIDQQTEICVIVAGGKEKRFDSVVICTGHYWPKKNEGKVTGFFDSPYPPSKLTSITNHPVAIRGSSLTAIDAIRTLARNNGVFEPGKEEELVYRLSDENKNFRIRMHSRSGLLPAIRFHLEDSHLSGKSLLNEEEMTANRKENGGFVSLDYVFEKNFKASFIGHDPEFYDRIKNLSLEEFVDDMMELRERLDPFVLFKAEYAAAEKSIKQKKSIYWKEMLAVLSFTMNYPAKYFSAEDMQRLQKVLMPLISIVIAFVPQSSCRELIALHDAGLLELIQVGDDSTIVAEEQEGVTYQYMEENKSISTYYKTYIDCVGQPHLNKDAFPFESLAKNGSISAARLAFQRTPADIKNNDATEKDSNGKSYLRVPGIAINDYFQILDEYGASNNRIFIMAVPYIGGYNPDYSGLDFCEAASARIAAKIFSVTT